MGKRAHTYAYGPIGRSHRPPADDTDRGRPQPYRYAYADPTGLHKMGHRYYEPTLGRLTQPDPSGQEANPYLYAGGDPINNADPSGLSLKSRERRDEKGGRRKRRDCKTIGVTPDQGRCIDDQRQRDRGRVRQGR
ncbi:RHS repeat-associated core domain-containing protein [Streptomyces sp. NPDC000351]|uniref:RHS repeat-associated core domain-containing protein n=1 Tax=Streptomyces sp. NPDC000351 TaxID=3154250 RepID=UPI0033238F87